MLDFRLCIQEQGSYITMGIPFRTYCIVKVALDSWRCIEVVERGKEARDYELL